MSADMIEKPASAANGRAAILAGNRRELLRVEGITYTIPELATATGRTAQDIRLRAAALIRRRTPLTLSDFHG